jgi:ribosomal protein S27AE
MLRNELPSKVNPDRRSIPTVFVRSLLLRCPACGESSILKKPFQIRHHCPQCRSLFKREEGFFVGAILANVMMTEFVIIVTCLIWLLLIGSNYETVLAGLFVVALIFPVAFYHHSWSFWLAFDYLIESLPKYVERSQTKRRHE